MSQKSDGMNYAPQGKPSPVVKPGEFVFAAAHLDHGHIYGQCNGLLEAGADANLALRGGETPLLTAARTGRLAVVSALLAKGARVDDKLAAGGQTALMWAAHHGHTEVVAALLAAAPLSAVSYEIADYAASLQVDERIKEGASAEYYFNPTMSVYTRYEHTDFLSTNEVSDFNENEVRIGMRIRH